MLTILQSVLAVFGFYLLWKNKKTVHHNQNVKPDYKIIGILVTLFVIFGFPAIVLIFDLSFYKLFIGFQYLMITVQISTILIIIKNKKALSEKNR
ncbi:hypothetical protein CHRY9390_00869 [Chryseobacterium aquaeductus]|uniref:Uncharacterized protein n=1 Tax=Chryseobacterium aquaeductus TaxID=2675056 RepID=A0A9N8MEQ3_9FLAO|nr:hypothetical protein [Chryseobacterium aquaeductus]CAA7330215.1 hypothetical protein CHRY9390_00869 [Chryseobacterium potabilaquae]CAD7802078.1 hypothetical protein CHRY9390_00869 [Chryseobacterium aquaeductus]